MMTDLFWLKDKQGSFSVNLHTSASTTHSQSGFWPWKMIWKFKISYKVACLIWLVAEQAILTQDKLMKRVLQAMV